ncbi:MAG: TrmB family transcriptional regulator [Thaumarchaeota archaeon]|nr:TrmB family transcriptional regulator [Nitrososphaerota archaeon]
MDRRRLVEELGRMGLTSYEAKCYVALAALGPSDPRTVAREARIPNPSSYEALRSLAAMGWADLVVKKPATYRAKKPKTVKAAVESRLEETFDSLEKLYSPEAAEETELVYTIRGREKVLGKIYEMLRGARRSVVLAAPTMGLEDAGLLELLHGAVERGVKVRAIGDDGATGILPPGAESRTSSLVAVDLLVDDKTAMISLPDYSACGWIDSPAVAEHFKQFLELMWNTSSEA